MGAEFDTFLKSHKPYEYEANLNSIKNDSFLDGGVILTMIITFMCRVCRISFNHIRQTEPFTSASRQRRILWKSGTSTHRR